jgi:LacI family transcriptional regulator
MRINKDYLTVEARISAECGYVGMQRLLRLKEKPTAGLCARDNIAIGAIRAVYDSGLGVPENISIIGYDDIRISQYLRPALTTIRQPVGEVGRSAGKLVLQGIDSTSMAKSISKIL